jgi:3-hydroxyisobutyrate dehydrogenase-like beta-hydroxyacid dehydrogenase
LKIGFIGLGIMGSRMATNLQKHGFELVVHNRTKAKAEPLLSQGCQWADTPAAIGEQTDLLFTMLSTPEAVAETALGKEGFLSTLRVDALWVNCSTVNPSFSKAMAEQARHRRIRFVEAPVAGTKEPAEMAQLLFLVGGDEADVRECQPFFEAMGRQTIHVGELGQGTGLKMVFNLLLGNAMIAFAEALVLGQSLGIGQDKLLDMLLKAPVSAPFLAGKRAPIESGEYEPEFPLQWMRKDLQLAATTAYEQDVALPTTNAAKEIYALAERYGLKEKDFSAIYHFLLQAL